MFVGFHQLPLTLMFGAILVMGLVVSWLVIGLVRFTVPRIGFWLEDPLPIRDSIIGACGGLFALIAAFSAAGIWNDATAARNAVQREADAIENAMVLSAGLPTETQSTVREGLRAYLRDVVAVDWPAMASARPADDAVFDRSETHLLSAIDLLSRQHAALAGTVAYGPLLNQILEVRHARLARIAASNSGMTWAQWIALLLISTSTLLAIAICNSHSLRMQVVATHIYVLVVSATYFVILAHDRPFVGEVSVRPVALENLIAR